MKQTIKEAALDYINSERECNFYAANHKVTLRVCNQDVDVETIWYSKDEDKVYLHVGCKEFEGDIDLDSLSDKNQERMREVLQGDVITPAMVPTLMKAFADKPLVFLFRVADVGREEVDAGLSREECFNRCINYYELDGLGCAWNDTDDDEQRVPEVKNTWCYVSMPEQKSEERTAKRDRLLKETIVMLAADLYQTIYDRDDCDGWGPAVEEIIGYAEQFERELNWQEDDDRDYIVELEAFEKKIMDELNKED